MNDAPRTPRWHVLRWLSYWWKFRAPWPSPWPQRHRWRRHRYRIRIGREHIGRVLGGCRGGDFSTVGDAEISKRFQDPRLVRR